MIRVFVADDHAIVRRGVVHIIADGPGMVVAGESEDGTDALRRLREEEFDVAVLDITMPGMTGLEVLEQIHAEKPQLAVIILSMHDEERYALRALKTGALGYLSKKRAPDELLEAIRTVHSGRTYVTAALAETMANVLRRGGAAPSHDALSGRELQVLVRIARGMRLEDIAEELFLSPKTVSTYRTRLLKKMGFGGNVDITRYAIQEGLLD